MSSLLVVVKSHLFPQFVHLNRERGKLTAVGNGRRGGCGCQSPVGGLTGIVSQASRFYRVRMRVK